MPKKIDDKNWRPAGWVAPDKQDLPDWATAQVYEAGASDMLDYLLQTNLLHDKVALRATFITLKGRE